MFGLMTVGTHTKIVAELDRHNARMAKHADKLQALASDLLTENERLTSELTAFRAAKAKSNANLAAWNAKQRDAKAAAQDKAA